MTRTSEKPRVLAVDASQSWLSALGRSLTASKVEFTKAKDVDSAIEQLNSGDYTAVIMDGLRGGWRTIVDKANELEVRPVVLSNSTVAVHEAQTQGVTAFHKNRPLTPESISPIVRAAIRPAGDKQAEALAR